MSLRKLLDESRSVGELKEIGQPVDWCEEMAALNYMVAQRQDAPVLWFQNIKDARYGSTAVFNLFGTGKDRIAQSLGLPRGRTIRELVEFTKENFGRKIPPRQIPAEKAPVNEIIQEGSEIDVTGFPSPKFWPLDGGRYLGTWDVLVTRDEDLLTLRSYGQTAVIHVAEFLSRLASPS